MTTATMIREGDTFDSGHGNTWLVQAVSASVVTCARIAVLGAPCYDNEATPFDVRVVGPRIHDDSALYLLGYAAWTRGETSKSNPYPAGTLAAGGWAEGYYAAESDGTAYAESVAEGGAS